MEIQASDPPPGEEDVAIRLESVKTSPHSSHSKGERERKIIIQVLVRDPTEPPIQGYVSTGRGGGGGGGGGGHEKREEGERNLLVLEFLVLLSLLRGLIRAKRYSSIQLLFKAEQCTKPERNKH